MRLPVPPRADFVPPPLPLPPPPFVPARRGHGWAVALIAIGLLGALLGTALLTGRELDLASRSAGEYRFLQTLADGSPLRWNPCQPIHYAVNLTRAPAGALDDVRQAVSRISDASGIDFLFDGETQTTAQEQVEGDFRDASGRWQPLLIVWTDGDYLRSLSDQPGLLGLGMPKQGEGTDGKEYVSGVVIVNADADIPAGFGFRYSLGPVLLHELGHVMGLGHVVTSNRQIMSVGENVDFSTNALQAGDRHGLQLVGRGAGCLHDR